MPSGHGLLLFLPSATAAVGGALKAADARKELSLCALAPLGLSLVLGFSSPSLAVPFPAGAGAPVVVPTTPFSQSRDLKFGLEDGLRSPFLLLGFCLFLIAALG